MKSSAEIAIFKKRNSKLSRQNSVLKEALGEMTNFFKQVDSSGALDSTITSSTPKVGLLDDVNV